MCCAAQQSGGAAIVREGQVAVAAHGPGVSRLPPQLGLADGDGTTRLQSRSHRTLGPARYRGGDSTACRCSFKSRVRQVDTSLKGELDLRRIPDGNCQGNSGACIGVQARVTHDSPRGATCSDKLASEIWISEAAVPHGCVTGSTPGEALLPRDPSERTFSSRHPVPNYYPRNLCSRQTQQSGASASGSASQAINHPNPDQSAHKHRSRFGDRR